MAAGSVVVVITGAALTVRVRLFVPCSPPASVTLAVKVKLPDVVGVPEITPAVVNATPAGNCPEVTVHVYGDAPPVACKASE